MKTWLPLIVVFFGMAFAHPFYMSVCEFKYNAKNTVVEGTVKLFANDLESALTKLGHKQVDIVHPKDTVRLNKLLRDYLFTRLLLEVNGKNLKLDFLGFEREGESIWCFVEYKCSEEPKHIKVSNALLYDFLKEQINIVHWEIGGVSKSLKVTCPEKELFFDF